MPSINILEKEVYNRIAAGEVVENPRSIVKELVENAIDAGATEITVEIENGGLERIVVIDNGCGILQQDVRKAFLPHATSKIKTAEDIDVIATLGFRGEALPSIASISQTTLKTIFHTESVGTKIVLKGGIEQEFLPCALDKGTSVEITSLFFNTPARFKFLKSARAEEGYITSAIQNLILANPTVTFRYFIDGCMRFASDGTGIENATKSIYPEQFDRLLPISAASDGFRLEGYISSPSYVKGNRSAQTLMVNGRVVTDVSLSATVQNAYAERLMTRAFPLYVLDVVVPFNFVDVNVHPNKSEIRLQNPRLLYSFIYRAVKLTLQQQDEAQAKAIFQIANAQKTENTTDFDKVKNKNEESSSAFTSGSKEDTVEETDKSVKRMCNVDKNVSEIEKYETSQTSRAFNSDFDALYRMTTGADSQNITFHSRANQFEQIRMHFDRAAESTGVLSKQTDNLADAVITSKNTNEIRIIGQIFSNYLIVEFGEKGFLIDQHAAHERTIFDKLVQQADQEQVKQQPLLVPYIFNGSVAEFEFLLSQREVFCKLGFDFDEFGNNSIKVNAVPAVLFDMNFSRFFQDLLSDINGIRTLKNSELLKTKLSQLACKSAIKAGDELNSKQISYFVDIFIRSGTPLYCPHGRPTVVSFDKIELEKRFKRKV